MIKHFLKICVLFIFFLSPLVVKADFGDLRYEITDFDMSKSSITFKGWAFIHKTNNFDTIKVDDKIVKDGGDQKILISAYNGNTVLDTVVASGSDKVNYNFYCELFFSTSTKSCTKNNYKNPDFNICSSGTSNPYCYYEDIYFEITFDTSKWVVSDSDVITFKIAASNSFFEEKLNNYSGEVKYGDDWYTKLENISITDASVPVDENSFMKIQKESISKTVDYIASYGILRSQEDTSQAFRNGEKCVYGAWSGNDKKYKTEYELYMKSTNYKKGRGDAARCKSFLGADCKGTHFYALKVSLTTNQHNGEGCYLSKPCDGTSKCTWAVARGSHIKPTNTFKITIKNDKKCDVTNPLPDELKCNNNGTLSSVCEELTVHTDKGSAIVKIEQTGTVSSVLTPDEIYAGGGFNFGIMYYNNIKWSYVGNKPGPELHNAINSEMNKKIKDYESYIAGINITNLTLGGKEITSGMVKKCFSSSASKDYYGDKGLTVSCSFVFPSSKLSYDGDVQYTSVATSSVNINNKYYTLLDKFGELDITVSIKGMDRVTEDSSKSDSKKKGQAWTGAWEDSIDGCKINVYERLYNHEGYNFIYRPIDIKNPFPNRNAGINWYDWYKKNKDVLENTYSDLDYTVKMNNNTISKIKDYNKNHNYLDWDGINENTEKSSFVTEYVERVGDS